MLFSCNKPNQTEPDLAKKIMDGIETLYELEYLNINSYISLNGKLTKNVTATVNKNMNQAKVKINDTTYYYFAKTQFKGNDEEITIVDNISFSSFVNLMGTTLLNFNFDKDNFSSIKHHDNTVVAQFVGKGAMYSFNTAIELSGGSFSIFFDNDKITKTVFSSSYKQNSNTYIYTAITTYAEGEKLWDSTPKVIPSNSAKYAKYILEKLSSLYPSETFLQASNDYNTSFKVSGIVREEKLMKTVYTTSESGLYTLTIVYTTPQTFIGIGGNINSIDLCYDDNNDIKYMFINDKTKYILN